MTSPLPRKAPIKRSPVKKRNAKRRKSEFARCYHSAERVEFVKSLPCVVGCRWHGIDNAHIENGGAGRKADYTKIVPLCWIDHRELHFIGIKSFEAKYGIDLASLAAETEAKWQEYAAGRARSTDG